MTGRWRHKSQVFGIVKLVLPLVVLLSCDSCGGRKTVLEVSECTDQDKNLLHRDVRIEVNGEMQIWSPGRVCRFVITLTDSPGIVRVKGNAGGDLIYNSPPEYQMSLGETKKIALRFSRPYTLKIKTLDRNNMPLPGVWAIVDNEEIGVSNSEGFLSGKVVSGISGDPFQVSYQAELQSEVVAMEPIQDTAPVMRPGKYAYSWEVRLRRSDGDGFEVNELFVLHAQAFDDNTSQPLPGVKFFLDGRSLGRTGSNGILQIEVEGRPGQRVTLKASKSGYRQTNISPSAITFDGEKQEYNVVGRLIKETPKSLFTLHFQSFDASTGQSLAGVHFSIDGHYLGKTARDGTLTKTWIKHSAGQTGRLQASKTGYRLSRLSPASVTFRAGQIDYDIKSYLRIKNEPPRLLIVKSTPSEAQVVIYNGAGNRVASGTTRFRTELPSGFYSWSARKAGYKSRKSASGAIDLQTHTSYTIEIVLAQPSGGRLVDCEEAFKRQDWEAAVTSCEDVTISQGAASKKQYVEALNLAGQSYMKLEDYEGALTAFERALDVRPYDYALHFNMALLYYAIRDFERCRHYCDEVLNLEARIPVDKLEPVILNVRYLIALIEFNRFNKTMDSNVKPQRGARAISDLRNFVDRVEDTNTAFQNKKQDALRKIEQIRRELGF